MFAVTVSNAKDASFGLMAGGPAQTHIGTGGGGSSSDMPWGEKINTEIEYDNNTKVF